MVVQIQFVSFDVTHSDRAVFRIASMSVCSSCTVSVLEESRRDEGAQDVTDVTRLKPSLETTGCFRVPLTNDLCHISDISGPIPKPFGMVNPTIGRFDKMHMMGW